MDKKIYELEKLLEQNELRYGKPLIDLNTYPIEEQEILKGILKLFVKHCRHIFCTNLILIFTKILRVAALIFFVLLICNLFPHTIVVIVLLMLNPIFDYILKLSIYSIFKEQEKIREFIEPYNLEFDDLFSIIDNEDINKINI